MITAVDMRCDKDDRMCFSVRIGHDDVQVFTSSEHRAERIGMAVLGIRRTTHDPQIVETPGVDIPEKYVKYPLDPIVTNDGKGKRTDRPEKEVIEA